MTSEQRDATSYTTPVEVQREQLERATGSWPARLGIEEGAGLLIGALIGAIAGGALALILSPGAIVGMLCTVAGLCLGAGLGGWGFGRRARRARAEFADLRRRARKEPPISPEVD